MKHKPNLNTASGSAPQVDWDAVRSSHGRPDKSVQEQHEADLAKLDRVPEEKAGRG